MNRTKIDWPKLDYLWNPVTGCQRGCAYCVVRNRVWPRIRHCYGNHDFKDVRFHTSQLTKTDTQKKAATFFVGFYSDPEYWSRSWWVQILDAIDRNPRHTFMFLTKNPDAYACIDYDRWPKNVLQGTTMTCEQNYMLQQDIYLRSIRVPRPFLSIEPLLGTLKIDLGHKYERVIIGAMTGPGAVVPGKNWIESIRNNVTESRLYWKKNIRKYL